MREFVAICFTIVCFLLLLLLLHIFSSSFVSCTLKSIARNHRQERDLQTRTDRFGVEVRERVMWDIRQGVVGADTFVPKHVAIITWKNMSFAGGIDISLFKVSYMEFISCNLFSFFTLMSFILFRTYTNVYILHYRTRRNIIYKM